MPTTRKIRAIDDLAKLPHATATDVKRLGWPRVMKQLRDKGGMVVTRHDAPEAVIVRAEEYVAFVKTARQVEAKTEAVLAALRRRFDRRLAVLQAAGAGDRLRSVAQRPARLGGKVKAGASH